VRVRPHADPTCVSPGAAAGGTLPKHKKQRPLIPTSGVDLRPRIERARHEGRFQQALELAKQLHKHEPTPAHLELLKACYLGRARQLRGQGYNRDAVTVLEAALNLDATTPAWLEQVANELAQSGGARQALAIVDKVPNSEIAGRVLGHAADAALQLETAGRGQLPAALQPDFDRILRAFGQVEAGQDDAARATLQEIGLRSPFADWKLFLRGLQAYYQRDDARAVENWQRLRPDRLPSRLAAPFRFAVDAAYRTAQPPVAQAVLQKQVDRLSSSALAQQLRQLRTSLEHKDNLAPAFRQAEALLPALRQQAPHLVHRLASCFYWAVIDTGPDDVQRFRRVFGAPPDDPHFYRLEGLAHDRAPNFTEAHKNWQAYEKEIAAHPEIWPGEQAARARALVWLHLGQNAAQIPGAKKMAKLPRFLRDAPDRPRPLKPSAAECYEKAIELAPDQIEPYEALFRHYRDEDEGDKAVKVARRLLEKFPDHAPTLEEFGDMAIKRGAYAEGLGLLQRALHCNPLDRPLRGKVGTAHLWNARHHAEEGRFDEARRHYEAALTFFDGKAQAPIFCRRAACEFKAGDAARAEDYLAQARALGASPLGVSYTLLTECARLKLDRKTKARFAKEFKAGLEVPSSPAAAADLVSLAASLQGAGVSYYGQKSHAKQIIAYAQKAHGAAFTEDQLEQLCQALILLKSARAAKQFCQLGERKFPKNPKFLHLQAALLMAAGPDRMDTWQVQNLLQQAEKLAQDLPPGKAKDDLLKDIGQRLKAVQALSPFGFFSRFSEMFGDWDEDDDDYDDDDDW
jgi:tetratricopeptide (TPR) repeat protein